MSAANNDDEFCDAGTHRLRARLVFTGEAAPIEDGTVVIESGRIVDVHDRPDASAVDLGNVALIPGLVNTHTHLEFSDLSEPLGPRHSFLNWIRNVVAYRRAREEPTHVIISCGIRESIESGATTLGEIATEDIDGPPIDFAGALLVQFRELIGFSADQIEPQLDIARRHLAGASDNRLVRGVSPHAPYSVHPELVQRLVGLACEFHAPMAMHLAETQEEIEFLKTGTGPFVEMLKRFGVWEPGIVSAGSRPLDYLRELARADRALVVHGNYLCDEELDYLAGHANLTLVYCPRTHACFGHRPHPWREAKRRGARVAIGTDSRASNPDLSLWKELQYLQRIEPNVSSLELIQSATIDGAKALGVDTLTGSLVPGKSADMAVVSLAGSPTELFEPGNDICGVMAAGNWIRKIA